MVENSRRSGSLRLGLFLQEAGHHVAAWRHPEADAAEGLSFTRLRDAVRAAEAAKFDFVFLADTIAVRERVPDVVSRTARAAVFDPLTLLPALAVTTERIGLIATASTTYNEPFHLARKFASLDHLSGGRAGWNLVTTNSDQESYNFSQEGNLLHADRYARAREFATVVRGLWDSWEDDAFLRDKTSGLFSDPSKVHVLNHKGAHFAVRGPLNVARPPQGHPVIVQSGSSEAGRTLAAETADVIFTAQQTLRGAQEFYSDVKRRVAAAGRNPDHLKIMPGLLPVVGTSAAEADDRFALLQSLIHPDVGLAQLSEQLGGFDLRGYPPDGPVPEMPETNGPKSRQKLLLDLARQENMTLRQLYMHNAGARGHLIVRGTPHQVADHIEEWFVGRAADGFNIMPPIMPGGLHDFIAQVIPELQRRGLFHHEYEGRTLRDTLGLSRPGHPVQVANVAS